MAVAGRASNTKDLQFESGIREFYFISTVLNKKEKTKRRKNEAGMAQFCNDMYEL